jgi:hypothetical protein
VKVLGSICCCVAVALLGGAGLGERADAATSSALASWEEMASWELSPDGLGEIRVGMTVGAVQRATGREMLRAEYGFPSCQPWTLAGAPSGLGITTSYGRVARIEIHHRRWSTTRGIQIGDRAGLVKRRYGVRERPHEYTRGRYLITRGTHRLVFEVSSSGKVTRFRAGRRPHVEYVEGCL